MELCWFSSASSASSSSCASLNELQIRSIINGTHLIDTPLDYQPTSTSRYQLLEDLLKVLRDLLECALNCFVLALIKNFYELLDRLRRLVKIFATLDELVALLGEVVVLFERFLVDMRELLEPLVHGMQLLHELLTYADGVRDGLRAR